MASFNGLDLGYVFAMCPAPNPNGRQVNTYPGASGLEVLDHGTRGGVTAVEGGLVAPTPYDLAAYEGAFRSLLGDGGAYTLVDQLGTAWEGVILLQFTPRGRVTPMVGGGYGRRYDAQFLHVI